jgi:hypothetical protein
MRSQQLPSVFFLALSTLWVGCDTPDPFLDVLPAEADVSVDVPESSGQALSLNERSEFYEVTYNVSRGINAHIKAVFAIMHAIVQQPATTSEEDRRVWGPSEPEGLERLSYRFTVTRIDENTYDYVLDARLKDQTEESDFLSIWSGTAHPGDGTEKSGNLDIFLDNNNDECNTGAAHVKYAIDAESRQVDVDFDELANLCDDEDRIIAHYFYQEMADASGTFQFKVNANIHDEEEEKPELESWTINSRWLADGSGRSDVVLSGEEIAADLTTHLPESNATEIQVTECWDDGFGLVYTDTQPAELREAVREELGEADDCAFAESVYIDEVSIL